MSRPEPQGEAETEGEIHSAMRTICQCPVVGRTNERTVNFSRSCHSHPRCLSVAFFPSGRLTRPPLSDGRTDGRTGRLARLSSRLQVGHYAGDRPRNRLSCNFGRRPRRPDYSLRASLLVFAGDYRDPLWDSGGRLGVATQPGKISPPISVRWQRRKKNQCMGKGAEKVERTPPPP